MRVVVVADSDSYLKWGAAVAGGAPAEWERRVVVLATPVVPSVSQFDAALAHTGMERDAVPTLELAALARLVADEEPDVVFLALRGPAVRVVVRAILGAGGVRPVFVSGMPGISFPATKRALLYRGQVDLILVHSRREREEFTRLAGELGIGQDFGLASLAFLETDAAGRRVSGTGTDIVFATQAKVPQTRDDRLAVLGWLSEAAERHPDRRVVVKLRARGGEAQTHTEQYPYDLLARERGALPHNLVFETGPMADYLDAAAALVTVSSTAMLEAVGRGIPGLVLQDFGVSARLINLVFEGSGLLGGADDLTAGRFRTADSGWLDANYFHPTSADDWQAKVRELASRRLAGSLPLRPEARRARGGALRRAWGP